MPLYDFKCEKCGDERENVFLHMSEIGTDREPTCCDSKRMSQILHPPMVSVQGECHYVCPKTGEQIASWKQRGENFARHGLMDANDFTPSFVIKEQDDKWGKIRKLAAQHDETNRRIVGGDLPVSQLVPAE